MNSYIIVDTDVFSCLWQGRHVPAKCISELRGVVPVLSFTSVAEAHFGAMNAGWGTKRITQMEAAMRSYVIAPYSPDMAVLWGKLKDQARRAGHPLGQPEHTNDLWICTTAVFYDAPLMTNNLRHFESMPNLKLITP
jgi:predicted nucleic acid-binding protein